ncbi:zinc ribbon 10 domain-containing protein [Fagus crenata]
MKRRSYTWRRMTRNLIAFSVIFEATLVALNCLTIEGLRGHLKRYDTDPAAKAAAATVLASKLGVDSGLNVYVGDESKLNALTGKSNDVELVQSGGLLYT